MEKYTRNKEDGNRLILTFIDLRPTFDSIETNIIWKCLQQMKVLVKLIQEIKSTYENVK